jgi:acetyltransferase-like isoleucine patch superfamily enzyme
MIGPNVTLSTAGHPVQPAERYDYITHAPIVIEQRVWIGAAATILPGSRLVMTAWWEQALSWLKTRRR